MALKAAEASTLATEDFIMETKNGLAGALRSLNEPETLAASLREEVLDWQSKKLGSDHPDVITTKNNLGLIYLYQNRLDEAAVIYNQILAGMKPESSEDYAEAAIVRTNLADLYWRQENYDRAEFEYKEILKLYVDKQLPVDRMMLNCKTAYGEFLEEQQRYGEAEAMLRESLEGRREYYGKVSPYALSSHRKICRLLIKTENFEQALEESIECLRDSIELYGDDSGAAEGVRGYFEPILEGLGRSEELEDFIGPVRKGG